MAGIPTFSGETLSTVFTYCVKSDMKSSMLWKIFSSYLSDMVLLLANSHIILYLCIRPLRMITHPSLVPGPLSVYCQKHSLRTTVFAVSTACAENENTSVFSPMWTGQNSCHCHVHWKLPAPTVWAPYWPKKSTFIYILNSDWMFKIWLKNSKIDE